VDGIGGEREVKVASALRRADKDGEDGDGGPPEVLGTKEPTIEFFREKYIFRPSTISKV
jgi:hypothetical protein